jgi:regulator of protease activity HflC (stomatin/prohibitin superfamily)
MEKQRRAEREKRATILTAEAYKQSQILTAEGERQSQILRAEGEAQAAIVKAEGEAKAIQTVFDAIHEGDPDPKLLAYQYVQALPKIAESPSSKVWVVPAELSTAMSAIAGAFSGDLSRQETASPAAPSSSSSDAATPPSI